MIIDLAALPTQLKFTGDAADIQANRKLITEARAKVKAAETLVTALSRACMEMCKHPRRRTYNDPRDPGGWDCPDCGAGG